MFLTNSVVANPGEALETGGPQWAAIIPVGMNAIAVPTSRLASVAYGVQDGSHVNITACMALVDVDPSFQTILPNHLAVVTTPNNKVPGEMTGITLGIATGPEDPTYQGRTEVEPAFQQGIYVIPSEPQRPRIVCQMILQDVQVLKLGTFEYRQQQATQTGQNAQQQQTTTPDQRPPDIITLVVSPQDAVTLTYMIYANIPLNLALRRSGDVSRQATEAATLQFLLSQYNIPVPVKLAYGLTPRIDILSLPFLPNDIITVTPEGQ
jgi:pilus assembly protein CpaB